MRLIFQFLFFVFLPPVFLLWKVGDFYIRSITFMFKAFFGIVAFVLKTLTGGALWPQRVLRVFYKQGVNNLKKDSVSDTEGEGRVLSFLTQYKLRYILVFVAALWLFPEIGLGAFLRDIPTGVSQVGILDAVTLFFRLVFIFLPLILVFIVSALSYEVLGDGVFFAHAEEALNQAKHLGSQTASSAAGAAASAANNRRTPPPEQGRGAEFGESALATASHIETAADTVGAEEGLGSLLEGSMFEGAISGAAVSAGYILAILLAAFAVYMIAAVAITGLLLAATWVYLSQFIPVVAGPILGALGVGEAYTSYFGAEAANSEVGVAARSGNLVPSEISNSVSQATAKLGCIAEGPQCMRDWRMNNTVRPGSEARGERYELQIEQFGLGSGDSIDVAYKEANYTIPINFLVSNTRNGLKGIPARNVSYKITVRDFDTKYCTTGWKPVSSFGEDGRDAVLPGLGVSPTESLETLNLGECELLQPSLGVDRVMNLEVKYQYSSQATLYVDAMSRQHRREQGIEPSFRKSETANTPVQSYINVKEPITYYETESGDRKVVPFSARFGFETPSTDVKYKVKPESIQIADSSLTEETSTCPGIEPEGSENNYRISDNAEKRINLRQNNSFFDSQAEPAPLRCTMALTQSAKNRISPTGEELIMRIDGNYTVVKEDRLTGFDVQNTLCTRYNCPLVVTEEYAESSPYNLYSKCTSGNSVDARGGCSIRVPDGGNELNWRLPNVAKNENGEPIEIEQGTVARDLEGFLDDASTDTPIELEEGEKANAVTSEVESEISSSDALPYGVPTSEEVTDQAARSQGVIYHESRRNPGSIKIAQLDAALCKQQEQSSGSTKQALRDYMSNWNSDRNGNPLQIVVEKRDCSDSIKDYIIDGTSCTVNQGVNLFDAGVQLVNPFDSVDSDQFDESACESAMQKVNQCDGVLVERRDDLSCYGGTLR